MTESRTPVRSGEAGVTLIELMVCLTVFSIGVLTLSAVQMRSDSAVFRTGQATRALSLGQERMEAARAAGFGVAAPDSGTVDIFDWNTDVISMGTGLDRIRVTVEWADGTTPRSIELNTLVAQR
jgi:prepilin-type N-terminal cleavage/methylation domain-containing protein